MAKKSGKNTVYEERFEQLLEPIAKSCGVEIYDVEFVRVGEDYYLRAYIDKEGSVTIDDCEAVSRLASDRLDEEDFIEEAYILEVSSPGLGRTLTKDRHLQRSLGEDVEIKLYKPVDNVKVFTGELLAFDRESISILCEGQEKTFGRKEIARISQAVEW